MRRWRARAGVTAPLGEAGRFPLIRLDPVLVSCEEVHSSPEPIVIAGFLEPRAFLFGWDYGGAKSDAVAAFGMEFDLSLRDVLLGP